METENVVLGGFTEEENPKLKKAKEKDKERVRKDQEDLLALLNSRPGRNYLRKLIAKSGVFLVSADNSGSWTYFKEGKRSIGLEIFNEIMEVSPEAFILMQKEEKEEN